MTFLDHIDAEELKRIDQSTSAKRVKRQYVKQGYDQAISLYGVVTNTETGISEYKRIEVLSNTPYTERNVFLIYHFLMELKPPPKYSIWIYDKTRDAIRPVGEYK